MSDPLGWIDEALEAWERRGLRRRIVARESPQRPARIERSGRSLANFSSNDYLGLAGDSRVSAAAADVARRGWGSGASPLITGHGVWHQRLEREVAAWEGAAAAVLFPSGYAANVGAITSLAGPGDAVVSDALNHASIIDGCRLSGAEIKIFPHADAAAAERLLSQSRAARRRLLVTDSLFSMDGDAAPLPGLADAAARHDAMLMVDEAHATGVFGERGTGLCEREAVRADVRVVTFSKALGSVGAAVVGSQPLIDWLTNRARTQFYSTALPEAAAAASLQSLEIVRAEPERRLRLLERASGLRNRLRDLGWQPGGCGQILPLPVGDADAAVRLSQELERLGFLVPAIRPPSVPEGGALLRLSLSCDHDDECLERLSEALAMARP